MTSDVLPRLPVSIMTGFLGSGKTTLLSAIVRHPSMARVAVIVNEFGEVGLDHLLVAKSTENAILLDNGCMCCTVLDDLVTTLRDLFVKRINGKVMPFDRIVIETTGLADPAPILHSIMTDPLLSARYRLDGVITTVDGVLGGEELDHNPESIKQAAVADRLVITKTDLADPAALEDLEDRLRAINPAAPFIHAVKGDVDPAKLFDAGLYNPATKGPDVARWLNEEAYHEAHHDHSGHDHDEHGHCILPDDDEHHHHHHDGDCEHCEDCDHDHCECDHDHDEHDHDHDHEEHGHHHHHRHGRHEAGIDSFVLTFDKPLSWDRFAFGLQTLTQLRGADLLRIKGIVSVDDSPVPIVVHGVQHMFHPPVELDAWPTADHRSKVVFITRNLGPKVVQDFLNAALEGKPLPEEL